MIIDWPIIGHDSMSKEIYLLTSPCSTKYLIILVSIFLVFTPSMKQ